MIRNAGGIVTADTLRSLLAGTTSVRGFVYEVETGRLREVV